jgi:hypothetical protein
LFRSNLDHHAIHRESHYDLISLIERDLFGKPISIFPDHAQGRQKPTRRILPVLTALDAVPTHHTFVATEIHRFRTPYRFFIKLPLWPN